jgi:hypothetical protein
MHTIRIEHQWLPAIADLGTGQAEAGRLAKVAQRSNRHKQCSFPITQAASVPSRFQQTYGNCKTILWLTAFFRFSCERRRAPGARRDDCLELGDARFHGRALGISLKFGELAAASRVWLLRNCGCISILGGLRLIEVRERIAESEEDRLTFANDCE